MKCHACLENPYSIKGLSHMAATTTLLDAKLVIFATVIIFMESKRK